MKKKLFSIAFIFAIVVAYGQDKLDNVWTKTSFPSQAKPIDGNFTLPTQNIFELNFEVLKSQLLKAPERSTKKSFVELLLPNDEGKMERFSVFENPQMHPELAAKFPDIKSYIGIGIDNSSSIAHFSFSPYGFSSMILNGNKPNVYIESITSDKKTYAVYKMSDKSKPFSKFNCRNVEKMEQEIVKNNSEVLRNANDGILRDYKLAVAATAEYTIFFGGVTQAMAAINSTITQINAIFERDFGVRMTLISNNNLLIYSNAQTDPFPNFVADDGTCNSTQYSGVWNNAMVTTLENVIGSGNYDVGHLFAIANREEGRAGGIGTTCLNSTLVNNGCSGGNFGKAGSYSASPNPSNFDFNMLVAHEMGHQFGALHTASYFDGGTSLIEPASGSTIMGYPGVALTYNNSNQLISVNLQNNRDSYFHAQNIQEVTNYIRTTSCHDNITTGNSVPILDAGLDYTIPRETPFVLTGSGYDPNGNWLTYNWEQMDPGYEQGTNSGAYPNKTAGPNFRSYEPNYKNYRYFPKIETILSGSNITVGLDVNSEALSSVTRTLNFRFTARDGYANNSDNVIINVNSNAGPFVVTSPNTNVTWPVNSVQNINWNVAGTAGNGINCSYVDILYSIDGGYNWENLTFSTPNDGSELITVPDVNSNQCRIMVKGSNHIFFDVSNTNFTISNSTCSPAINLSSLSITTNSANLQWDSVTNASSYTVEYKLTSQANWVALINTTAISAGVGSLSPNTQYDWRVKTLCQNGNVSTSSTTTFTTLPGACSDPTGLVATPSSTSSYVSWNPVTGALSYTLWYYNVSIGWVSQNLQTNYSNITGLTPNTTYDCYVQANCSGGSSNYTYINFTTLSGACSDPTGLVATPSSTSTYVSWNPVPGALSYTLWYYNVSIGWVSQNLQTNYSNITGLTPNTTYDCHVRANCSGSSSNYTYVNFTTLSGACSEPSGLVATPSSTSTYVSWNPVTGAISYTLWYYNVSIGWVSQNLQTNYSNITGLTPNTTYDCYVRANCSGSNSNYTYVNFTTLSITASPVPIYYYYQSDGGGNNFYSRTYYSSPEVFGHTYYGIPFRAYAAQATGTVAVHRYFHPQYVTHFYTANYSEIGDGSSLGFIYEGEEFYAYTYQHPGTVPVYRYFNQGLINHYYTTNFNELGSGSYGWAYESVAFYAFPGDLVVRFAEQIKLSKIESSLDNLEIKAFPNPTTGMFTLENENSPIESVILTDFLGKVVFEKTTNDKKVEIDLSSFPNGIYFAKVKFGETLKVAKIIKE
jgi:hypothetical protein